MNSQVIIGHLHLYISHRTIVTTHQELVQVLTSLAQIRTFLKENLRFRRRCYTYMVQTLPKTLVKNKLSS